jgi:DNA helicase HerA-like ATPase
VSLSSDSLTTHAVCVGMTGSGKTGLCLALIEEAAIDGVPVIAIDPKGDLTNLLLTFPGLSAAEFAPWVNADEARSQKLSIDAFAAQQADLGSGPRRVGRDGARISNCATPPSSVYTRGEQRSIPVSI